MKPWTSTLARFAASGLIVSILTQSVFAATFSFGVSFGSRLAIDYEGSGTIQHMNAGPPEPFTRPPTSLLDLNIMRASDLRLQISGSIFGNLNIGQPAPAPAPDITFVSYTLDSFEPTPTSFVLVSESAAGRVFALNPTAAGNLQSLIDLHGADNLFLSLSLLASVFGGGSVSVFSAVREINIDIKPGNNANVINPNSRGRIPVAVLTTPAFDANSVDVDSLRFGVMGSEASAEHSAFEDVDGDGDLDLVLHFRTQETAIECGTDTAFLKGTTLTGELIGGRDSIVTVGCN